MNALPAGRLHVITDETLQSRFDHVELARLAAAGGADVVQFREKRPRPTSELVRTAVAMLGALEGSEAALVVNDRADVALAAGADGVHLGRDDLEPRAARRIVGEGLVGRTANSLDEAVAVCAEPVDYLGIGPVFGTSSKAQPAPALGTELLERIVAAVDRPVIAIGGITLERVPEVMRSGVHGIAVLSDVICSDDPASRVSEIRQAIGVRVGS